METSISYSAIAGKATDLFSISRYYDEMPYEEMSRILETSEGCLKSKLSPCR